MIEEGSAANKVLCLAYDQFDAAGINLESVTWEYHVVQICRLITIGILAALEAQEGTVDRLDEQQRKLVKFYAERFLGDLSADEFKAAISAVKSFGDKANDLWEKWGGPIAGVVNIVLERLKLQAVELDDSFRSEMAKDESLRYHLTRMSEIVRALDFRSIYVLIDRVDEIELTATDAAASFVFIRPMLVDLPTLEADGYGFKFFLWDAMKSEFAGSGLRTDRVALHELQWSPADLQKMIGERLSSYSDGRIRNLKQLFCDLNGLDVDALAAHLAEGSPRDLIRLMATVVAEETRVDQDKQCIAIDSLWRGVSQFSATRSEELFPGGLAELRKVGASGSVTFTVNKLANDIYRVTTQATRARVQNWRNTGMIDQIGDVPNPGNRPLYLFGPVDLRLAVAMLSNSHPEEVLGNFALLCPACGRTAISDQVEITCLGCSHRFALGEAQSLVEACTA
jgi:hypothetical protein